jgi:hypothetical protein
VNGFCLCRGMAFGLLLAASLATAAQAQSGIRPLFSFPSSGNAAPSPSDPGTPGLSLTTPDRPVPPGLIPLPPAPIEPPAGEPQAPAPAAVAPGVKPAPRQPSLVPPAMGGIMLSARFGREETPIKAPLHWRVFADQPETTGQFRMIKEERGPNPSFVLPPGNYIVHVSMGLANAARRVQLRAETVREVFDLPVGGVRFAGHVGNARIPNGQISFDIYSGSQFEPGEKHAVTSDVQPDQLVLLPEGPYHVVSSYGDGNAVMRYDLRVRAGKLTDARISHRAAVITLKLVSERGGEALANTAWSVLTPGGDVIKESIGAFPTVILAEGEYVALARNEGRVFNREFKVETGVDREIEVLAR